MNEKNQGLQLQQKTVNFYGDRILVMKTPASVLFSMPTICDALHLNVAGQIQRIQRSPDLATFLQRLPVQTGGGIQRIWCLHEEGIAPWIAGLRVDKLKPAAQEKLPRFQNELLSYLHTYNWQAPEEDKTSDYQRREESQPPILMEREQQEALIPQGGTSEDDQKRLMLTMLSNVYPPEITAHITTTSSQIDQSIREASFADRWDLGTYLSSNNLQVYLGSRQAPLDITEAQAKIRQIGGSTALTGRLIIGLWNLRRHDQRLSLNGRAAVRLDEILAWRGMQKHQRSAYTAMAARQRSDGYRAEHKQQIVRDLDVLSSCCVRGTVTLMVNGRQKRIYVDGPYLEHSTVSVETSTGEEVIGFFITPGDWIHTFDALAFRAEIDQRIFQLHPQNEQHELRLALFLVEEWRQRVLEQRHDHTFKMEELLAASMIEVDYQHITRFIERIERALATLGTRGILGEIPQCVTPVDRSQNRWGIVWLTSLWRLVPPATIVDSYASWDQRPILKQRKKKEGA